MTTALRLALIAFTAFAAAVGAAQPPALGLTRYSAPEVRGAKTDGSAVVALTVRANGEVDDAVTLTATDRMLANAVRDAVALWRFERDPEVGRGRDATPNAVIRREIVEFDFRRQGVVQSMSHLDGAKAWLPERVQPVVRTVLRHELDMALEPRLPPDSAAALVRPAAMGAKGTATVSFVIAEKGRVRVPIVVGARARALGDAALDLVRGWRFDPPSLAGEPVLVEDRKTLSFD
jgi:TonB family protein